MKELSFIRKLAENDGCREYLSKPYGIELLFLLWEMEELNADNGIDDTYDQIRLNKPRRAAFSAFIQHLADKNFLVKKRSANKASKTTLRLSDDISTFLNGIVPRHAYNP